MSSILREAERGGVSVCMDLMFPQASVMAASWRIEVIASDGWLAHCWGGV